MAGGTGTSSRGRGGKFKKYTRGGGKHFSRDLRPVDAEGNEVSMWSDQAQKKKGDDDDDDDDSDSEEESEEDSEEDDSEEDSDDEPATKVQAQPQATSREDRKAQKKARKDAAVAKQNAKTVEVGDMPSSDEDSDEDDDMPANPNHSKAARKQATSSGVNEITEGMEAMAAPSRREREAIEAAAAKEKYMRLQAQGKTDEAKADLARLKLIREQREIEAARRQAEKEEREELEKKKKAEFEAREARKKEVKKGKKK